jgi:hypothetical protein
LHDEIDGGFDASAILRHHDSAGFGVRQQLVGGQHEPQRSVDRVVLGGRAGIVGESVGQHAL